MVITHLSLWLLFYLSFPIFIMGALTLRVILLQYGNTPMKKDYFFGGLAWLLPYAIISLFNVVFGQVLFEAEPFIEYFYEVSLKEILEVSLYGFLGGFFTLWYLKKIEIIIPRNVKRNCMLVWFIGYLVAAFLHMFARYIMAFYYYDYDILFNTYDETILTLFLYASLMTAAGVSGYIVLLLGLNQIKSEALTSTS